MSEKDQKDMHQKERKDDMGVGKAPKDQGALRITVAALVEG